MSFLCNNVVTFTLKPLDIYISDSFYLAYFNVHGPVARPLVGEGEGLVAVQKKKVQKGRLVPP